MAWVKHARDVAAVANCLCCDTYFVMVLTTVPPAKNFTGGSGKQELEEKLASLQAHHSEKMMFEFWLLIDHAIFPVTELIHGKSHFEVLQQRDLEAALTVCQLVSFDGQEAPPLYMNNNSPEEKPKWALASGLGPPALELDRSHSNRIYKPSLRPYGIVAGAFSSDEHHHTADNYKHMCQALSQYVGRMAEAQAGTTIAHLSQRKPLYCHWQDIAMEVEAGLAAQGLDDMEL